MDISFSIVTTWNFVMDLLFFHVQGVIWDIVYAPAIVAVLPICSHNTRSRM